MSKVVLDQRYLESLVADFERYVKEELKLDEDDNYTGNKVFIVEAVEMF